MSDWNRVCEESIRQQRKEAEARYGIRFGQTEIYCSRCGRAGIPGVHTCQDIRFEKLRDVKEKKQIESKTQAEVALKTVQDFGYNKSSILLKISENTVKSWIQRGKLPKKYIARVCNL